jgi:uncharacterized protein YjgD (DUF1641 family)
MEYAANTLTERLSEPKTMDALSHLLDSLTKLHEDGALDSFIETVQTISAMKDQSMDAAFKQGSPMSTVTDVITFMTNSVNDKMIEHNAEMMGELLAIANEAADPCMVDAIREMKRLQKSGNLKTLSEASDMVAFMFNAVTDTMVQRLTTLIAAFVEEVSTPHVQDSLISMTKCLSMTVQEFAVNPPKPGVKNMLKVMKDPEVQQGVIFMSTLAKNMHRCMIDTYSGE